MRPREEHEQLLDALRAWHQEHGRAPTQADWDREMLDAWPSSRTIQRYDGWGRLVARAPACSAMPCWTRSWQPYTDMGCLGHALVWSTNDDHAPLAAAEAAAF